MAERIATVVNKEGLHARPAGLFVKMASGFKSTIQVEAGGRSINAKSMMGLMGLGLTQGMDVRISANGDDAEQAVEALANLVNRGFAAEG